MTAASNPDFPGYVRALLDDRSYQDWQELYTPIDVEDRQLSERSNPHRRLKLMAQSVPSSQSEKIERLDVLEGLRKYAPNHVLLVGRPGSGKSTSLERLLWEEAEKERQKQQGRVPVLVRLRRYSDTTKTVESLIRDFLISYNLQLDEIQIETLLIQGHFLLLLDGLNELPDGASSVVAGFRDKYRRTTPMIFTTRDLGVGGDLGIEKKLKMLPLTNPQMRDFVRAYLPQQSNQMLQKLGSRLQKFGQTPLLLWMLCRIYAQEDTLPTNLGFAFRDFAQLYDRELKADVPHHGSKSWWSELLQQLAFTMMHSTQPTELRLSLPKREAEDILTKFLKQAGRPDPRNYAKQWLEDLLNHHLIQPILTNREDQIEFRHQLLQEYYAAEYLLQRLDQLTNDQLKCDYLNCLKWTESLALMLALTPDIKQAVKVVQLALEVDLQFGARLAGEVKPEFQEQTVNLITKQNISQLIKINLLGITRSEVVIPTLIKALEDKDSNIRWCATTALGQLGCEAAIPGLLKGLENHDPEVQR